MHSLAGKERLELVVGFIHDLLHAGIVHLLEHLGERSVHISGSRVTLPKPFVQTV